MRAAVLPIQAEEQVTAASTVNRSTRRVSLRPENFRSRIHRSIGARGTYFRGAGTGVGLLTGVFGQVGDQTKLPQPSDPAVVAYLHAMPGAGKTYLVERWFWLREQEAKRLDIAPAERRVSVILDRNRAYTAESLRDDLIAYMKLPVRGEAWSQLRAALNGAFIRIENVDSRPFAEAVHKLLKQLDGCRAVVCGRWYDPGQVPRSWQEKKVRLLTRKLVEKLFIEEVGKNRWETYSDNDRATLLDRMHGLPRAVHLAAGYLISGHQIPRLLERLSKLALRDFDDERNDQVVLEAITGESLHALGEQLRSCKWLDAEKLLHGFHRLGWMHPRGVGRRLASAISGLNEADLEDLVREASSLHLLDTEEVGSRIEMHPHLAEQLQRDTNRESVSNAVTDWFCERLPEPKDATVDNTAWQAIHGDYESFVSWLAVPNRSVEEVSRIERAGSGFAIQNGPFPRWMRMIENALQNATDDEMKSKFLWTLGQCAVRCGELERALAAAEEKSRLDISRSADRESALASGLRADILQTRGELDEALRIRREEELPVYERQGDVRSRAVTMGKIADILQTRGELDEALRIRREEELPVYERLGDVRSRAVTMGKIADILQARGELDEALRIWREEELPVYERLGDVHSQAVTMGKIADILQARGEPDEALRIRREEQLPVYERLGDVRSRAVTMGKIAEILQARGKLDEALRIRREEQLPVYERLGDVRSRAVTMGKIADILQARGKLDEALRIWREEETAGLRAAGGCPLAGGDDGKDRRHPSGARRAGRSVAHPARGRTAGLRVARGCPLAGDDDG